MRIMKSLKISGLVVFICTAIATLVFAIAPYFFPKGVSYRSSFASRISTCLLVLWLIITIILAIYIIRIIVRHISKKMGKYALVLVTAICMFFALLFELLVWFFYGLNLPTEQQELDNGLLYMLSADFLDPYNYYSEAINGILQKELSADQQRQYTRYYPDLDIDQEYQLGVKQADEYSTNYRDMYDTEGVEDISDKDRENWLTPEVIAGFSTDWETPDADGYENFDDFATTYNSDIIGTWYNPEHEVAIRLLEDNTAYLYFPLIDYYGDTAYKWEYIDRSESGLCPELIIDTYGYEGNGVLFYIAGVRDNYFWCNEQSMTFYKQDTSLKEQ